jgi:hypothetical protein
MIVNDELERMWKEGFVIYSEVLSGYLDEGLE